MYWPEFGWKNLYLPPKNEDVLIYNKPTVLEKLCGRKSKTPPYMYAGYKYSWKISAAHILGHMQVTVLRQSTRIKGNDRPLENINNSRKNKQLPVNGYRPTHFL